MKWQIVLWLKKTSRKYCEMMLLIVMPSFSACFWYQMLFDLLIAGLRHFRPQLIIGHGATMHSKLVGWRSLVENIMSSAILGVKTCWSWQICNSISVPNSSSYLKCMRRSGNFKSDQLTRNIDDDRNMMPVWISARGCSVSLITNHTSNGTWLWFVKLSSALCLAPRKSRSQPWHHDDAQEAPSMDFLLNKLEYLEWASPPHRVEQVNSYRHKSHHHQSV